MSNNMQTNTEDAFAGIARLYGKEAYAHIRAMHVCVVGIGGVGSWVVEALARSAVGKITLIDYDTIAESNIIGGKKDDKFVCSGKTHIYCLPHHSFDSILFPSDHSMGSSSK